MKLFLKSALVLLVGVAIGATGVVFFAPGSNPQQPYADEQGRAISSLSAGDVEQLEAGKGWGLAKPAEFNGYPGPAHVLEFSDKLSLSDEQLKAVQDSFDRMQAKAASFGKELIAAELALDEAFRQGKINSGELSNLLDAAEKVRARLREVHLAAHLEVTPLLSEHQKQTYASLRGYGSGHNGHKGH